VQRHDGGLQHPRINVGDIIVIPEGVPHASRDSDHVTYLSVRPDLKKVLQKGYVESPRSRTAEHGRRRSLPSVRDRSQLAEVPRVEARDVSSFAIDAQDPRLAAASAAHAGLKPRMCRSGRQPSWVSDTGRHLRQVVGRRRRRLRMADSVNTAST